MKITVIMAAYNAEHTIEQAICSVINQTHKDIEFLIIDGKSTDTTLSIVEKYLDKIEKVISEPDHGIYEALNKGLKIATGDYIYVMGADDCLVDYDIMKRISSALDADASIDVLSGRVWLVEERYAIQTLFDNNLEKSVQEDWINRDIKSPHQGFFIRAELMKQIMFDERFSVGADYKILIQLWSMDNINIKKIPEIVAFYSADGTSSRTMEKRAKEYKIFLKEMSLEGLGFEKQVECYFGAKAKFKALIRKIMELFSLRRRYLLQKGWQEHHCENKICRWCGRGV